MGKRGTEFKLPYPIIDSDPGGLLGDVEEPDELKSRPARSKKSKTQLRDYLQAGRKRKAPYRDVYPALNGYGYSYAGQTDRPDLMYPYPPNNFTQLDPDVYRSAAAVAAYHPLGGAVYGGEGLRLDGSDKSAYTNGYYLEARQYQHTLQYHSNGYDVAKYPGYDVAKYPSYDSPLASYGLDLSKRAGHFESDVQRYDAHAKHYAYDYGNERAKRVGGATYDALRNSAFYGTNSLLDVDGLMGCNTGSACSLYGRTDTDRYGAGSGAGAGGGAGVGGGAGGGAEQGARTSPLNTTDDDTPSCSQKATHLSVIRSLSPCKSPPPTCSRYPTADCSPSWPHSPAVSPGPSGGPSGGGPSSGGGVSCIVSPKDTRQAAACNAGVITAPTSVIQQPMARTR